MILFRYPVHRLTNRRLRSTRVKVKQWTLLTSGFGVVTRCVCIALSLGCLSYGSVRGEEPVDFAHKIVPLLKKHCAQCHMGTQKKGGLSMNTREDLIAGGESGIKMLPENGSVGEMISRVTSSDPDLRMPPEGDAVPADSVAVLKQWVDAGAPWESGFTFGARDYEPPLLPRRPELPKAHQANRSHPIDRILDSDRIKRNLELVPTISDERFVRRAYLDLVGLLPSPEQTTEYANDTAADKSEKLIRQLLSRDIDYTEHWLTFWNDLLRNDYSGTGFITGGRQQISKWLYESLVINKPYNVMAQELIAPPTGESAGFGMGIRWRGEVSAGQTVEIQFAQNVGQAFLGINLKCASCHDSFIDRWTLKDAYGLAAIYSNTPLEIHRCDKPIGQQAKAAWLFPEIGNISVDSPQPERLKQLATLMTQADNGRFARTIVNRLWHRLMGYGVVHPVDAMQSKPWNEDLLDYLAVELVDRKYDLKEMIYLIATSEAYRSENEVLKEKATQESYFYAGSRAKRMTAEQFVDTVWQLTGAAPTAFDAPVLRGKPGELSASAGKLEGKWIWTTSATKQPGPAAGEKIAFRKTFEVKGSLKKAVAVVSCDNEYKLWINGRLAAEDNNWETIELLDLMPMLKEGENEIAVLGVNAGNGPNPAALYFEAVLEGDSGIQRIASDTQWKVTTSLPGADGKITAADSEWQAAVEAPGPWGARLSGEMTQSLSRGLLVGSKMVRASLVKADFLMRSLGRPNRDQIVSMRPTELTQLEAMDLSNGQTLADWLHRGAMKWHQEFTGRNAKKDSESIAEELYQFALSRSPTSDEKKAVSELIGEKLEVEDLEDMLWAIIMLPEFQYVR